MDLRSSEPNVRFFMGLLGILGRYFGGTNGIMGFFLRLNGIIRYLDEF